MAETASRTSLRPVLERAIEEARGRGSATVEAEHLLLALAADGPPAVTVVLAEAGLDYEATEAALREEHVQSLAVAGIGPVDEERLVASPRQSRPGWGASAKAALKNAELGIGRTRGAERNLLIGLLQAELGTVPRALAIAGVDRDALITRLRGI
ncbi:Clp amino terminal domain-containing protein, pathogenicity island component [Thermomonospora echinospora]|uniref:Clp amino terminal domain-containing protein, pathogenicity island component n=1 Tax=Thermomonospora echinospora TaxID=1992 RepID=A0A1H5Z286_9ACTN|nr:Clp protease N-terminal domain-containing protein [Thermomonospora echinospora]SEG30304.1 Clp amino terminal domain-containing protein, pathogenicity island component [Thermomonospora echinospora]